MYDHWMVIKLGMCVTSLPLYTMQAAHRLLTSDTGKAYFGVLDLTYIDINNVYTCV